MWGTRFYLVWVHMKERCYRKKHQDYKNYGARSINVCDRWQDFGNFKEDMFSTYKKGLTLGRIDNNGDYSPQNCRWENMKEQSNNRRSNYFIEYKGIRDTLTNWANYLKMNPQTLRRRLKVHEWTIEKSFFTPVFPNGRIPING